ncbi:MAG: hypothetical protein ABIH68_05595 [bacterium]
MNELKAKIDEVLKVEEKAARDREEAVEQADKILKETAKVLEKILEDAETAVRREREEILLKSRSAAEMEVKKMGLDAEILAKKNSVELKQKKEKIFQFLFQSVFE